MPLAPDASSILHSSSAKASTTSLRIASVPGSRLLSWSSAEAVFDGLARHAGVWFEAAVGTISKDEEAGQRQSTHAQAKTRGDGEGDREKATNWKGTL
jgi:hypothetical protein